MNDTMMFETDKIQQLAQAGEQVMRTKQQELASKVAEENLVKGEGASPGCYRHSESALQRHFAGRH